MSRPYQFYIQMNDHDLNKKACHEIEDALTEECFDDFDWVATDSWQSSMKDTVSSTSFEAYGRYNLGGGQSEEEEVSRLQNLVWSIAGKFVRVGIAATYMPGEYYSGNELVFKKWQECGGEFLKRCRVCNAIIKDEDLCMKETNFDDVCWQCEDDLNICGCGELIDAKDPDEKRCMNCKVAEAEALEDR